jgi:hypothetical protein
MALVVAALSGMQSLLGPTQLQLPAGCFHDQRVVVRKLVKHNRQFKVIDVTRANT